ncbi:MAG: ATP-binding cassette domain-containing protein [Deltaproteobacteria bacterium]|jgi:ABC-type nitrate/sulfonate/bicarbonate transport system ATPase subunit|nr:ATP-binding cassette domain-containing protein [Deltaproteobacteria bacterium]
MTTFTEHSLLPALEGVSKSFGGQPVLRDLALSLAENGITCLLGPSGCGKSTLLRITAGLLPPDSGQTLLNAHDCAMVFQEPRLLPWLTVEENLGLALRGNKNAEQILQALKLVELGPDIINFLPRELSGGMAQRVGIARALLRQPRFLILDEPFAAIDAITRGTLQKMLAALIRAQKITCLFVTHDLDEALLLADRLHVMRDGKLSLEFVKSAEPFSAATVKEKILARLQNNQG